MFKGEAYRNFVRAGALLCCVVCFWFTPCAQDPDSTLFDEVSVDVEESSETEPAVFAPVSGPDRQPATTRPADARKAAAFKSDDDFWYVDEAPKRTPAPEAKPKRSSPSLFAGTWFRNLLWVIIVGGFLAILFFFLRSGNVRLFEKRAQKMPSRTEDERVENIFDVDYDSRIAEAVAARNFRYAIRFLYLGLLKEMAQKGVIRYAQERTNSEYIAQLWNTAYYKDFFSLTRSFEYTWYGEFNLSEDAYRAVQQQFALFKQRLHP